MLVFSVSKSCEFSPFTCISVGKMDMLQSSVTANWAQRISYCFVFSEMQIGFQVDGNTTDTLQIGDYIIKTECVLFDKLKALV